MRLSKLVLIAAAIVVVACSSEQSSTSEVKDVSKIGSQITRETANTMIGNVAGRQSKPEAFIYGKTMLQEILNVPGAEGIIIFNGLDNAGIKRLIFKPANSSGGAVANSKDYDNGRPCPPSCPTEDISSIGKVIEANQAKEWAMNFQAANSNSAHSYLFGKEAFIQLLSQQGVAGIAFMNGAKASGEDAFVLVGVKEDGALMWEGTIWDDGLTCPSNCPPSND